MKSFSEFLLLASASTFVLCASDWLAEFFFPTPKKGDLRQELHLTESEERELRASRQTMLRFCVSTAGLFVLVGYVGWIPLIAGAVLWLALDLFRCSLAARRHGGLG